ncbi:XRE family transcriptional regulator [Nocardia altamirensis]|uniref:XRE family transcriptional regulator n=1 Tax=Nocardia altamirensis TaxID=472158 RepID=UPI00114D2C9A|nr:XRE family transcriptional regulator [Nocardia altamirensis]
MEQIDRLVSERVRRAMSEAGLCPEDLAARSGLAAADLRGLLAAHGSFTVHDLGRIAAVVDCHLVDLFPVESK